MKPRDPLLRRLYEERCRRVNEPIPEAQKDHSLDGQFPPEMWQRLDELNKKSKEGN